MESRKCGRQTDGPYVKVGQKSTDDDDDEGKVCRDEVSSEELVRSEIGWVDGW